MKATRIVTGTVEAGCIVATLAIFFTVGLILAALDVARALVGLAILATGIVIELFRRLHSMRDTVLFCVALACAWAAAQIDDPAPAVTIAAASR